jgi:hypothetical protein
LGKEKFFLAQTLFPHSVYKKANLQKAYELF